MQVLNLRSYSFNEEGHDHDQGALVGGQMDSRIRYMDLESTNNNIKNEKNIKEAIYFRSLKSRLGEKRVMVDK